MEVDFTMAERYIYSVGDDKSPVIRTKLEFDWVQGTSIQSRRKSALNLQAKFHANSREQLMEISTAAPERSLGFYLSAFNLKAKLKNISDELTVEQFYQGSKVVSINGTITSLNDLYYSKDSVTAKKDSRLKYPIVHFQIMDKKYPIVPKTAFYNWIYINSMYYFNRGLYHELTNSYCNHFCDTQAPITVDACQAEACALLMYMHTNNINFKDLKQ